ncbi:MAG: LamG-like jellyroll fold domain-containing protein [Armatimonadota bacterium]|nr:LamG-like jellyroll fold domain-containing protein [Armatimonadota bacterium]
MGKLVVIATALTLVAIVAASGDVTRNGLILYLDASSQVKSGGTGPANDTWRNLAGSPDSVAGPGTLHGFRFDGSSGWVGSGAPGDPYALRFDGKTSYVLGPGNIELAETTLEAWALVEGHTLRGATLIGNDFGQGGVSLMVQPVSESPMLLNGATFTVSDAEFAVREWQQVAIALKDGLARIYVNGAQQTSLSSPRSPQKDHRAEWQLGAARHPENDFVEADGLIGSLAIVRVYNRALSGEEIRANFDSDRERIGVSAGASAPRPIEPPAAANLPGLGRAPAASCAKWDYYNNSVRVTATNTVSGQPWPPGWPYGPRWAFDGYPTSLSQPYVRNYWRADAPTPDKPVELVIDYRRPVAVSRFVHYFNTFRTPCAWKGVDIYSSNDKEKWALLQSYSSPAPERSYLTLPPDAPQVLGIEVPSPARFYRIVIRSLADGAPRIETHEIETYYGDAIGSVDTINPHLRQSEGWGSDVTVCANVFSEEIAKGMTMKMTAPEGTLVGMKSAQVRSGPLGGASSFDVLPLKSGRIPVVFELYCKGILIDRRPHTIVVEPKLAFKDISPAGAVTAKPGDVVTLKGTLTNAGGIAAEDVKVSWMGQSVRLGGIARDGSATFEIKAKARPGYSAGLLTATDARCARSMLRRAVICPTKTKIGAPNGSLMLRSAENGLLLSSDAAGGNPLTGKLALIAAGKSVDLTPVSADKVVAAVPGGVLAIRIVSIGGDQALKCAVVPDDPESIRPPWLDLELRLAVDKPKIMFRPHIDWYEAAKGPNAPYLTNGHNSATRMLCVETTDGATLSMVPNTDNMTWGFNKDNEMVVQLQMPLAPNPPGRWRPIWEAPMDFTLRLPVRKGDWWDAYRHAVKDVFKFEQARQWAMPITQMQMLSARYTLRSEVWSEKWQTVRSHPWFDFFYNFYGTTYTLPTLYSWYLVTDDMVAREKAAKVLDWLLSVQVKEGPTAGAWFSQYGVEGDPPRLVGRDQANNRWVMPHSTATAAKTLLWYWEASGKKDARAFAAAKQGVDWLVNTQRADGGWPYAFDLEGKPVTDLADAGQIWNTWGLWKMWEYTNDARYRDAAIRSKDFFKKTFMDVHRYMGYWEDVSGASGKVHRSWEGYEPAIAALVFADMGDKQLAVEAAKDAATWTWTRVISTRQYETGYGETTEQSLCGPSQAQSPMVGIGAERVLELTGDPIWSDFAGAMKSVNFACDPDQAYGMVATGGWDDPLTGVVGPPYENVRPWVTPNISKGDEYGRQVWNEWCTNQFAWLALEWLVREGNIRAPQYVKIDPNTYRGSVLGLPGRVKMPEEKCDVNGIDHYDINWVGYQNDANYVLLLMNHKEKVTVAVRPHEAHLDVYTKAPKVLIGSGRTYEPASVVKKGVQYFVDIPAKGSAVLVWDRIK